MAAGSTGFWSSAGATTAFGKTGGGTAKTKTAKEIHLERCGTGTLVMLESISNHSMDINDVSDPRTLQHSAVGKGECAS